MSKSKRKPVVRSMSWLKRSLDTYFSQYIRNKYSVNGICTCYTCGKKLPIKQMQNGHFISRGYLVTRWNENNCRPQCLTEESNVSLLNGETKSIKDVRVGDKILAFDDITFEKKACVVEQTNSFIPSELYEVELEDGNKFFATGDHQVVSSGKWIKIEDMLHIRPTCDIMEV